MPECAIDAPMAISLQGQLQPTRTTRSPLSSTEMIVPVAVTMPVNITDFPAGDPQITPIYLNFAGSIFT
jgi:hypothetical protein